MEDAVATIHLAMNVAERSEPVSWRAVVSAVAALSAEPSADHEQLLVQLLSFSGPLNLGNWGHLPHSQSPVDMIHTAAIDALWQLSGPKYAAVCQQVAAATSSPIVKRLVAARFPSAAPAKPAGASQ